MMNNQTAMGIVLLFPLIIMIFPSVGYWRDYRRQRGPKTKAAYSAGFLALFVCGVIGMWVAWLGGIGGFFFGYADVLRNLPITYPATQIVGGFVFFIGAAIYNWVLFVAGKYVQPAPSGISTHHQLTTKGPFALVRHPLYVAYAIISIGLMLVLSNWWVGFSALGIMAGMPAMARAEEENLLKRFGDDYRAYQKCVGKFFPKLKMLFK